MSSFLHLPQCNIFQMNLQFAFQKLSPLETYFCRVSLSYLEEQSWEQQGCRSCCNVQARRPHRPVCNRPPSGPAPPAARPGWWGRPRQRTPLRECPEAWPPPRRGTPHGRFLRPLWSWTCHRAGSPGSPPSAPCSSDQASDWSESSQKTIVSPGSRDCSPRPCWASWKVRAMLEHVDLGLSVSPWTASTLSLRVLSLLTITLWNPFSSSLTSHFLFRDPSSQLFTGWPTHLLQNSHFTLSLTVQVLAQEQTPPQVRWPQWQGACCLSLGHLPLPTQQRLATCERLARH